MSEKLKVYMGSVSAFSQLHEKAPRGGTYVEHRPFLIRASSITEAAEHGKEIALKIWPINETWYSHTAAIQPITQAFLETVVLAYNAGAVDLESNEEPKTFFFDA